MALETLTLTGDAISDRYGMAAVYASNDMIYLFGGDTSSVRLNDWFVLDPSTLAVTDITPVSGPAEMYNAMMFEYNGDVYVYGGDSSSDVE